MKVPLWRRRQDEDLNEEVETHLRMAIDDRIARGETPVQATRNARRELGNIQLVHEVTRDTWGWKPIEQLAQDVRYACRMFRRTPGFAIVCLATLALGIGTNTVMFSVVNTLLLRPLPYPDSQQLLLVQTVDGVRRRPWGTSPPDFYSYRTEARALEHLDAFYFRPFNLTGSRDPERIPTLIVSAGFFGALRTPPIVGRGFVPDDERWGSHRVVVLTDGLWKRRFGADPAILGQIITLNSEPYAVVGILPPKFSFIGLDTQLFVPMSFAPGDNLDSHSNYFLSMIGRLKPGVTLVEASTDMNRLCDAIIAAHPENKGTVIDVTSLREALVKDVRQAVLVLLGAVGFVLLISCANLANLLLARAGTRRREIAVRVAIGASRTRLLRQFLTESLLLAILGGALGLGLAFLSIDTLNALSQRVLPRAEDIQVDTSVLLYTFAVATLTGILFGLAPAMHGTAVDLHQGLNDGGHTGESGSRHRLRAGLVIAEVALSLLLLVGAGLMVKSMYRLLNIDPGFDAQGVMTMQINLPAQRYVDQELERRFSPLAYVRSTRFFADTLARVGSVPGVRAAGAINGLPLMGEIWGKNVTFYDRPLPGHIRDLPPIQYRVVAGDYFRALGIQIRSGRAFTEKDTAQAPKVAIVNRELVRRYWNDQDPLGKVISVNPPLRLIPAPALAEARRAGTLPPEPDTMTVVGVAADALYGALASPPLPLVYAPFAQASEGTTNMFLAVRTDDAPLALVSPIREQIRQIDPDLPIASIQSMDARVSASVTQPRMQMIVLGSFATLAVILAAIGIYGVMSYAVTQRTREIGIRMALGAARREVLLLIVRQGLTMVAAGVGLGVAGAVLTTRVLRTLLFGVSATDPSVFLAIVMVLSATASLAVYIPARRATKIDPLVTLRYE
jgi:putative ABC transport system permease protein